jgi:hypothetical protein
MLFFSDGGVSKNRYGLGGLIGNMMMMMALEGRALLFGVWQVVSDKLAGCASQRFNLGEVCSPQGGAFHPDLWQ